MENLKHWRLCLTLFLQVATAYSMGKSNSATMFYDFASITPTPDLSWVPCFDNYTCTILQVPLDYTNLSVGNTTIAYLKLSSKNESAIDILYNPGGPGSSGVNTILSQPEIFLEQLGTQYYNFVGFDPRGVNNSGIDFGCFPDNLDAELSFSQDLLGRAVDTSSHDSLYSTWLLNRGWGQRCTTVKPLQKQYGNTVANAQDLLYYTELLAKSHGNSPETSKLWYFGQSYGTVLGQTFATLFPERVGRMILDGNGDAGDYFSGTWQKNLFDTDAGFKTFFEYCFAAGKENCVFFGNASSADEIEKRFYKIYNDVKRNPILVDAALTNTPVVISGRDIQQAIFESLYSSLHYFPDLAQAFVELEQRNATAIALGNSWSTYQAPVNNSGFQYDETQSRVHIACIDAAGRTNLSTFDKYEDRIKFLTEQSFVGGTTMAQAFVAPCEGLDIMPPTTQYFSGVVGSNSTSNPILFIGNTFDCVAPLKNAQTASLKFRGSQVLQVNGTAHCSTPLVSPCVYEWMQKYMLDATLPPSGTICEAGKTPFSD